MEASRVVLLLALCSTAAAARASAAAISAARALGDRSQEGGDLARHHPRVTGPDCPRRVEAASGELDQLVLRAARIESGEGFIETAGRRVFEDLRTAADIRRPAGQNLAKDRSQGEDVRLFVQLLDLSARLFGTHVGRRADDGSPLRTSVPSGRANGRHLRVVGREALARTRFAFAALSEHLRQAPVDHLHLAESTHHDIRRLEVAVDDPAAWA